MNEPVENFARLQANIFGAPEGVDGLLLDAINLRAFLVSLAATENNGFEKSYLCSALTAGSTYALIMKIAKLYDRRNNDYETNTLRENWRALKINNSESSYIESQFDTRNENSVFYPIINYRDKTVAHNESKISIEWPQIDSAIMFLARVWELCNQALNAPVLSPFYKFEQVSGLFSEIFDKSEIELAGAAHKSYIERIQNARNQPLGL